MIADYREYRRRIEAVMRERVPSHKVRNNGFPWKYVDHRVAEGAIDFAYSVPIGYSVGDLERHIDALAASCGTFIEIRNNGGVAVVSVLLSDFPAKIRFKPPMLLATDGRRVLLGFDQRGRPVEHSFETNPHILVGGTSGYGKTDALRFLLLQLVSRFTPEQLEIQIIDAKGFSFLPFPDVPHISRIARTLPEAVVVLEHAYMTMQERAEAVWSAGERDVTQDFRWLLVIVDEGAQISSALQRDRKSKNLAARAEAAASSIACVGREAGVALVFATQRPDAESIPPQVKANMEAALCFRCKTESNSRIILDRGGAELLPVGRQDARSTPRLRM